MTKHLDLATGHIAFLAFIVIATVVGRVLS
jgi:hypothetical protein